MITEIMKLSAVKGQPSQLSSYDEQQQPPLLNSVTEDEDDSNYEVDGDEMYGAESYIRRYEAMVGLQDDEIVATLSHLRPMLELLENLSHGQDTHIRNSDCRLDSMCLVREFHYSDVINALNIIEEDNAYDFIRTDRQWMMVLKALTKKVPEGDERISWGEIVQCYRIVINAMQTLEHVTTPKHIRKRARERSMSMLSLFHPPSNNRISNVSEATSLSEIKRKLKDTENLPKILYLIFAFAFGALMMATFMVTIPSQHGRSLPNIISMPIVPGPIVAPSPLGDSLSPVPVSSTSKRSVPESISNSASPPTLAPTQRPIMKIPPVAQSLKLHRNVKNTPKEVFSALLQASKRGRRKALASFSDDDLAMAAVVGGTATVGLMLPALSRFSTILPTGLTSLLPVGFTVIAASLVAHGLRELIGLFLRRLPKQNPFSR